VRRHDSVVPLPQAVAAVIVDSNLQELMEHVDETANAPTKVFHERCSDRAEQSVPLLNPLHGYNEWNDCTLSNGGPLSNGGSISYGGQLSNGGPLSNRGPLSNCGSISNGGPKSDGRQISNSGPLSNGGLISNRGTFPSFTSGLERIHNGLFTCTECGEHFTSYLHLHLHSAFHNPDRNHVCTQCDKRFVSATHLELHELIHSDETLFTCSICSEEFTLVSDLRKHELIHTNGKLYSIVNACEVPLPTEALDLSSRRGDSAPGVGESLGEDKVESSRCKDVGSFTGQMGVFGRKVKEEVQEMSNVLNLEGVRGADRGSSVVGDVSPARHRMDAAPESVNAGSVDHLGYNVSISGYTYMIGRTLNCIQHTYPPVCEFPRPSWSIYILLKWQ